MKAMQMVSREIGPVLQPVNAPQPVPGLGEVLIQVHAAGVITTELGWYPTTHTKSGASRTLAVPGHEFSGVIAALGPGVTEFALGDTIYGMNDWFQDGATAEFCLAKPEWIAAKPARLTHQEAATVPISALTAWQGLLTRAKVKAGDQVLIHGGSGAVGLFAVQLARLQGAHVTATVSARNAALVRELGARTVIDYRTERFEDRVSGMDIVFDTVGGETLERSWNVLKPGGHMVTIASTVEGSTDPRAKEAFFIVEPNHNQLVKVGQMLDPGKLRTFVNAIVPFEDAPAAYGDQIVDKRGYGKVVVSIV
jgi:NADPH:quinone reductase-like Zn-dependent oxidoreductase